MHGYCSKETEESRRSITLKTLIAVAVPLTPLMNILIQELSSYAKNIWCVGTILNWIIENGMSFAVSYVSVFSFLFLLVDRFLWKNVLSKLLKMPNLNGTWEGTLQSNNNGGTTVDMTLCIKQTWTKIQCTATFPKSSSSSTMARIFWQNDSESRLEFTYSNESQEADVLQRIYNGYNWFTVRRDHMIGFYFTDRTDQGGKIKTDGYMDLTKKHGKIYNLINRDKHATTSKAGELKNNEKVEVKAEETLV